MILMAISNKFGAMVVTTGNKSEMSVGYATLYGDMNGGFNPIKDLYKMEVFRLARAAQPLEAGRRARARTARSFRENIIDRAADAPNCARTRRDQDSLPPYRRARRDSQAAGREGDARSPTSSPPASIRETVKKVERLLYLAEYKRRQSAPGVKVDAEEFRPRPALSDRQPVPRSRLARASARRVDRANARRRDERTVRRVSAVV